ncbi:hydantoinase/oxoprolinase N-terminal domain-containing protein [Flagellimonas pacifica]|uniref:N-methylhydantoinase A/oxoprolinase/acetone carboxylase, beta subunit n=1 Tax=Flagellimonas pacifica TaxID=1247520 RepID=A0A285MDS3_9FLAO|nr:hydantoinase/oxoprolinase family protein [Allomuricauda parva]SNY95325.1 N-methylhydantoinase A/oxoprolinase/acetone carboxylase, beta subunit [Allomuricauda parva]
MYYKIGVDVGGTNTDAVLVSHTNEILAKTKQTTTLDVSSGIRNAINVVISEVDVPKEDIKYIMLGTTHCTNALVERKELNSIGAIRIGLPASVSIPTMADFPDDLKILLGEHNYMVHGGYEFDGRLISSLNEEEVKKYLFAMKGEVESLAITGIFSKTLPDQELQVADWAKEILGSDVRTSCSHQLGGLGLLERENAAILNAALQKVASKMVDAFKNTVHELGLSSQLFIGQNDGTLMSLEQVQDYPVLTISSGPTNSIRGAGALSKVENGIVIDVGGTTSDGGVLVNFFPRESTQAAQIGGVLTNFRMPDVVAVGIGGGTIVRFANNQCILGPDSVGYQLKEKALAFGGDTPTLSDFFIANDELKIEGAEEPSTLRKAMEKNTGYTFQEALTVVKNEIQLAIEKLVDKLKTDSKEIPVIACGGGAFLLPKEINGASSVIFPEHLEVANAFGACIAQIGCEEEMVINTLQNDENSALEQLLERVKKELLKNGALEDSINILAKESIPLAYLPGAVKLKVKVCGDLIR